MAVGHSYSDLGGQSLLRLVIRESQWTSRGHPFCWLAWKCRKSRCLTLGCMLMKIHFFCFIFQHWDWLWNYKTGIKSRRINFVKDKNSGFWKRPLLWSWEMGCDEFGKSRKKRNRSEDIHYKIRQPRVYDLQMARHMAFSCDRAPKGDPEASQCLMWLSTSIICNWWKSLQYSSVATCSWALEI